MNLLLYPYTKKNRFLLPGNGKDKITGVCARNSHSVDMDYLNSHGIFFCTSLMEQIEKVDGILFYPDHMAVTLERTRKRLLDEIKLCLNSGKQVFCVMELSDEETHMLKQLDGENGHFHQTAPFFNRSSLGVGEGIMEPCDTPMIYVGAICEGLMTEEFTLQISNALKKRGYRVCTVLDDPCAKLAGCHPTPKFLYEKSHDADKVFRFHNEILALNKSETPDVFVIQIPGSIYPLCQNLYSDLAMKCLYYSRAFCPDVFFCITPSNLCDAGMITQIHEDAKVRYGYGIDAVLCRQLYLDKQDAFQYGQISLMPVRQPDRGVQTLSCGEDQILTVSEKEAGAEELFCDLIEKILVNEDGFETL